MFPKFSICCLLLLGLAGCGTPRLWEIRLLDAESGAPLRQASVRLVPPLDGSVTNDIVVMTDVAGKATINYDEVEQARSVRLECKGYRPRSMSGEQTRQVRDIYLSRDGSTVK